MTEEQPNFDDREFLISRYIDGDLSAAQRRELESALEDDPEFTRLLEDYHRTDVLVRSLRETGPELNWDRFVWEVRRRREAAEARRRRVLYRLFAPLAAAAAIVLVCTAYFSTSRESPGPGAPVPQVLVRLTRPVEVADMVHAGRVVTVQLERTPPPGFCAAPSTRKSYVIAAAGAKPFERPWVTQEPNPYF